MREIKFRVWGKVSKYGRKKMYHEGFSVAGEGVAYWTGDFREEMMDFADGEEALMQYTGLKDKNGKEIYEGDVIRYETEFDAGTTGVGAVRWSKYVPGFAPMTEEFVKHETMEVIGNIHENPELVNESK